VFLRTVVARRTRLKGDLAGSHGTAGVAATAQTDLDVHHDGASVGTIRFAASDPVAAFFAASETILEPGLVRSLRADTPRLGRPNPRVDGSHHQERRLQG
jgi:hypothetical protein